MTVGRAVKPGHGRDVEFGQLKMETKTGQWKYLAKTSRGARKE